MELSTTWLRQIDKAVTSVVLDIGEANGRRIETDRCEFLERAESSAIKEATYIHLCTRQTWNGHRTHVNISDSIFDLVLRHGIATNVDDE